MPVVGQAEGAQRRRGPGEACSAAPGIPTCQHQANARLDHL